MGKHGRQRIFASKRSADAMDYAGRQRFTRSLVHAHAASCKRTIRRRSAVDNVCGRIVDDAAAGRRGARRPVSRVLSAALASAGRPFLWDARCRAPRATNPGDGAEMPLRHAAVAGSAAGRPYSVLLPVGFALPPPLPGARCALAAPFHPCRQPMVSHGWPAVCFLWHFPWGRPRRPLAGTVFPWSPDFPPPAAASRRQRPSGRLARAEMRSAMPRCVKPSPGRQARATGSGRVARPPDFKHSGHKCSIRKQRYQLSASGEHLHAQRKPAGDPLAPPPASSRATPARDRFRAPAVSRRMVR